MEDGQLSVIKQKINQSSILSDAEKQEWLFLLPKMTDAQKAELTRILEVRMPQRQESGISNIEYGKKEEEKRPPTSAVTELSSPITAPLDSARVTPPSSTFQIQNASLLDIKGLSFVEMRQAPSIYDFFDDLGAKMVVMVKTRQASPEEIIQSFQDSALYKQYLKAGQEMLEGRESLLLTKSEFEAVADFRSSLKKILASAQ